MCHSSRNGLELLCCGDEAIVLFMTTRRGGGCVFVHGSGLLESTPAKHGSAQIARMWPTRLCRSRRLRRAGGRRTILLTGHSLQRWASVLPQTLAASQRVESCPACFLR